MPGQVELLVMSVTRLGKGVCVACVTHEGRWVRPTRETADGWRQLEADDLRDRRGQVIVRVGNVVRWPLGRAMPRDIHTEDHQTAGRPVLLRRLSTERFLSACGRLVATDFAGFLEATDRSLTLIRPQAIQRVCFDRQGRGGITAELWFEQDGEHCDYKVTDLAWRALGRGLLNETRRDRMGLSPDDLRRQTSLSIRYLVIGRGREFEGDYWPFVTTVVTDPLNRAAIDYNLT